MHVHREEQGKNCLTSKQGHGLATVLHKLYGGH